MNSFTQCPEFPKVVSFRGVASQGSVLRAAKGGT